MRIKANHILFCINALTLLLILIIAFLPENVLRIILGLPFVLFIPGYTLIAALFPRKSSLESVQRLALSLGLSLAVVPLIGLILNYTTWGINLNSILYSLCGFVFITSIIAWFRQLRLTDSEKIIIHIEITPWNRRSSMEKVLSIVLIVVLLGLVGVIAFIATNPKSGQSFTEFYALDYKGKVEDAPLEINQGDTVAVTLGIVNHEQRDTIYNIEIRIDGVTAVTIKSPLLSNDEKYETIATFEPQKVGDDQKVAFLLFKNEETEPYTQLHIWVDVK